MKPESLKLVFTGPETSAILLKSRLEECGIYTLTKNDYSGSYLGFTAPSIDLFIRESDLEKASGIIDDFSQENKI